MAKYLYIPGCTGKYKYAWHLMRCEFGDETFRRANDKKYGASVTKKDPRHNAVLAGL